jgi:hypothetical protein
MCSTTWHNFFSKNLDRLLLNYFLVGAQRPFWKGTHEGNCNHKRCDCEFSEWNGVHNFDCNEINFEITYFTHYDVGNRSTQISTVHVWLGQNPINDLVYGYGGVKLLPRTLTINMDTMSSDMTTSISKNFRWFLITIELFITALSN